MLRKLEDIFIRLNDFRNVIYAGNDNGLVYALNANDGEIIWQLRPVPELKWNQLLMSRIFTLEIYKVISFL